MGKQRRPEARVESPRDLLFSNIASLLNLWLDPAQGKRVLIPKDRREGQTYYLDRLISVSVLPSSLHRSQPDTDVLMRADEHHALQDHGHR